MSRRKRLARTALIVAGALLVMTGTAGAWFYTKLNGNIHSVAISGDGTEKANAAGQTPINILVLGSDGRVTATDCALGGGCSGTGVQSGQNADVEMVVHISADRSNATVMSVPRDTMTQIPSCKDSTTGTTEPAYYGQINSALQYGPACQAAAVHQLTGIPIDHFLLVGFSGLVTMSDAVGGVSVCVNNNVYDTYSHLKLSKGTHTLKGVAALEFLRSRHGFGDGSDLGRTLVQHMYLSSLMRKLKSTGTLTNPADLYSLSTATTKALTVDTGLDSVAKLAGLATDIAQVPTNKITFTTMQTLPDPANDNRLVVAPAASALFKTIIGDQSLSAAPKSSTTATTKAGPNASASPKATVPASSIAVQVENGTDITGRAAAIASALIGKGFSSGTLAANAPSPASATTLSYGPGQQAEAQTVAAALKLPSSTLKQSSSQGLTLVIGSDWPSNTTYPTAASTAKTAKSGASVETASQSNVCAQVSTFDTVEINGVPMTPMQAYADSPNVPNSAP
jgi:LCP family protein required for cell wall assembly